MMKKLIITLVLAVFVMAAKADVSPYTVNDQQVEAVFTHSKAVSLTNPAASGFSMTNGIAATGATMAGADAGGKNFATALLLNLFLGGLGIHRLYLGTKTFTWVGYILTCGGIFGIVPLVDLIVLIINNQDISPYVDNPKFFMWANS